MMTPLSRQLKVIVPAIAGCLLLLGGCNNAPVKKTTMSNAGTQPYLDNLDVAHYEFERSDDLAPAAPYLARLNAQSRPTNPRPTNVTVVMLTVKTDDDSKSHKLMVPVVAPGGRAQDLSNLKQMVHILAASKPEYRTIHIRTVTLATREPVAVRKAKESDIESKVNDLYQTVYESNAVPPHLDAARLQITLTKFFMHENVRDAAYVSLENAKELLAGVDTSRQEDADEVQALSQELENLENTLHKKLPYTF